MKMYRFDYNFTENAPMNSIIPALVQIMDWRRAGDKPLYESMVIILLAYICVTRPQWVNLRTINPGMSIHTLDTAT